MTSSPHVENLLRELAPQVLGVLVRRYGVFDICEDAVQEALLAAHLQWPSSGVPESALGWLVTVASHKYTDYVRSDNARRVRESSSPDLSGPPISSVDDSLELLFLCCHPELPDAGRIALTLRAVGGLTTGQIAAAFLVPEKTMGQRISRAKQVIRDADLALNDSAARLAAVRHVLYLIFNEGYTTSGGASLTAPELSTEAIRLTRMLHRLVPDDAETAGLLALMLLTDARRPARTTPDGMLVPLAEQDRTRWDSSLIAEGVALISHTLPRGEAGPLQVQAAIAAVHDEAATAEETDWPQILMLYDVLLRLGANPMVSLNRTVAVAMVDGPQAGLDLLESLASDPRLGHHHRLFATRGFLLGELGRAAEAAAAYREASRRTSSVPERRHLAALAASFSGSSPAA